MRELRMRNDNSIGFVDPYIVFKAPQAVWTASHETDVCTNLMRFFVNQKEKQKILFPLQLRVSYILIAYFILLIITRDKFYIVIYRPDYIYICVNSFHWILMVIEISKKRLIIFDSMRKPQENYQQMVNIIQRYVMSISDRRIS